MFTLYINQKLYLEIYFGRYVFKDLFDMFTAKVIWEM